MAIIYRAVSSVRRALGYAMSEDKVVPPVQSNQIREYHTSVAATSKRATCVYTLNLEVDVHSVYYERGSLVDRGANGGMLGQDATIIHYHQKEVDITGIDNHELNSLKTVDATARVMTQKGPVILILRHYALYGVGRTIHSCGQIEYFGNKIDDKSKRVGGRQCITTPDGYVIPLNIKNGLPYLPMRRNTKEEFETLPHVFLTGGEEWDPTVLDHNLTDQDDWYNQIKEEGDDSGEADQPFDERGHYKRRELPIVIEETPEDKMNDGETEVSVQKAEMTLRECYFVCCDLNSLELAQEDKEVSRSDRDEPKTTKDTISEDGDGRKVKPAAVDYEKFRPYFLYVPVEKVQKTFENTTRFAVNVPSSHLYKQTFKSPYPALNVPRRNEPVAMDPVHAQVPAIGTGGSKIAQVFVGRRSRHIDIEDMKSEKETVNALEDVIRKRGAMDKLISDGAKSETSDRIKEVLRSYCIDDWQSERNYQHQNFAEHVWKSLKRNTMWIMSVRKVDPEVWLLCLKWVAHVMNHTVEKSLGWRTPNQVLTGQTSDISILLCFMFWDKVAVPRYSGSGYSEQIGSVQDSEIHGRFVGFADSVGHNLTFLILTDDTKEIIARSRVRLMQDEENEIDLSKLDGYVEGPSIFTPIIRKSSTSSEEVPDLMHSTDDDDDDDEDIPELKARDMTPDDDVEKRHDPKGEYHSAMEQPPLGETPFVETVDDPEEEAAFAPSGEKFTMVDTPMPTIKGLKPEDLPGRTFLMPPEEDGSRHRAKIIKIVNDFKNEADRDPEVIKFKCLIKDEDTREEIIAYNKIVDYIEDDDRWEGEWKFNRIITHKGGLRKGDPEYRKSGTSLLVEWEDGTQTWEPLNARDADGNGVGMYQTDPVTVAIYARENNLLDTPGWKMKGLKKMAKTQKRLIRFAHQAKLQSYRTKPVYKYGFLVPRNHDQAMEYDADNKNTRWKDAETLELKQVNDYETFLNKGKGYKPGSEYTKIKVHFVYDVKHDGRHKARLVAGGHMTDTPLDSVYSSVVSLRGVRILTFLAEHNECETWATDIGNAYLESKTKEKVYIVAGPEFQELEGCTLIIDKALYGLKSSGLRWHERFADVLKEMGFFLSKAETDIWMRDCGDHYEYIAVYVDDLLIVSRNPQGIIDTFLETYKFKLKGTGAISFHLGCDFFRDENGDLCYAPRKYIDKMMGNYQRIFGQKPRKYNSPLEKGDHPEIDESPLLDEEQVKIYQSLIGALQWVIQIGRFDIATAVMTLSRFRAAPREGHLQRVKRIHGYLYKFSYAAIRINTDEPDYSGLPEQSYDWEYTCYPDAKEPIPHNAPKPLGKPVRTTSYVDANLLHDLISGRSVTGTIHMLNRTPVDYFSKLQSTVETATFGSEYVATRICTEQIIDLRLTLRYLGVPLRGASMMFGDNESVVLTASRPHGKLHKRHVALSFHRVREAIAAGITAYYHVKSPDNAADIVSKHWDLGSVWKCLQAILFWPNGGEIPSDEEESPSAADGKAST